MNEPSVHSQANPQQLNLMETDTPALPGLAESDNPVSVQAPENPPSASLPGETSPDEGSSNGGLPDVASQAAAQGQAEAEAPAEEPTPTEAVSAAAGDEAATPSANETGAVQAPKSAGEDSGNSRQAGEPSPRSAAAAVDLKLGRGTNMEKFYQSEKMFFKMGDVCDIVGVESHVIRFWESEFRDFSPKKNRAGHRIFSRENIEQALLIRRLLYEEGYTVGGARKKLETGEDEAGEIGDEKLNRRFISNEIKEIKRMLNSVLKLLDGP